MAETEEAQPPRLILVDADCENCGAPLAWRVGVGRYVITHATSDDVCSRATARLAEKDREVASRQYRAVEREFERRMTIPPGGEVR